MSGVGLGQAYGYGLTFQRTVHVPNPAAGSGVTFNLQPWDRWRLIACTFKLTTAAGGSNRYVTIEYPGDDTVSVLGDAAAVAVTPSTTAQRFCGSVNRGTSEWNTGTDVLFPLSGLWLEAGRSVVLNVANIGNTDTLTAIYLTFDVWPGAAWLPAESDARG